MKRSFARLGRVLRHCGVAWRLYALGTAALFCVDLLDTAAPKVIQWAIDHLELRVVGVPGAADAVRIPADPLTRMLPASWTSLDSALGGMWVYAAVYVFLVAITGLFRYWMSIGYAQAGLVVAHELRRSLFSQLQGLESAYHDRTKIGDHMALATTDIESCRMFYGFGMMMALDTLFYFLLVPVFMATISWKLMLACALTLPLIPFLASRITHTVEDRYESVQEQFGVLSEFARESYAGAKVIKSFAQERAQAAAFLQRSREYLRRGLRLAMASSLQGPMWVALLGVADLVAIVYGGELVLRNEMSVGQFAAFFQYLIRLSGPMLSLGWVAAVYQRGRVSLDRVQKVLDIAPTIVDGAGPRESAALDESSKSVAPAELRGDLELRGLTFAYPGTSRDVLSNVSLRVPAGRTLGIVGPVGSGKSTLLALVPRLYDPPVGTLRIDGIDVRELPLATLRAAIAAVPQEPFLFGASIAENIAFGTVDDAPLTAEEAAHWARLAQLDAEIEALPQKYDTVLGERGVNLSGGQKQRLTLARALARQPAIFILDDCLSAVDTATEARLLRELRAATANRTTLIASHRISTVQHADEIVVLSEGRITERGNHRSLLALGGYYAELCAKQETVSE